MKSTLTSKGFWAAALERAIKTVAQTAVATIGATALVHEVDWVAVASAAGLAGILSLLTSVASAGVGQAGPALAGPETISPAPEYRIDSPSMLLAHSDDPKADAAYHPRDIM